VGAPLTDSDAALVALLRRAGRLFASLGGGRTAASSGEKVEQYRVERDLLLALFASELPLPVVSSLFDVSSSGVRRLLEHTSNGDELEPYIREAKQKRAAQCSTTAQPAGSAARARNLICKRTGRPMRDENAYAQSFFQRPHLAQADISTVWGEYVRETTAAVAAGGGDGAERKPPLSRAHFFTLAPEERRRKRKEQQSDFCLSCEHCGQAVKQAAKTDEVRSERPAAEERKDTSTLAGAETTARSALDAGSAKRAKLQRHTESKQQQAPPVPGKKKVGRPKRAVQRSSLTSEMRALLPALLAEQSALSSSPPAVSQEHLVEVAVACS